MVLGIRSGWGHAHLDHGLLLGERGLTLLVGPIAADGTRAEPFAIHGAEGLVGIAAISKGDETVAARATSLHVPHDAGLGDAAKCRKGLEEDLIVDLVGKVADKDVEVVGRVFLVVVVGLVSPVDADFLDRSACWASKGDGRDKTYRLVDASSVQGLHGSFCREGIVVLDKPVVEPLGLELGRQ